MQLSLLALKDELNNDPTSIGYVQYLQPITARDNFQLASLLNLRRAGIQVSREPISTMRLFSNIDASDFLLLTSLQLNELHVLLTMPTVDLNDSSIRQILQGIFVNKTTTLQNFAALRNRVGSRYEQLTSPGEVVSPNYISQALES